MKRSLLVCAVVGAILALNTAAASDPPWTPGDLGTTHQEWYFNDATNPTGPDVDGNPLGPASLTVHGSFPLTNWLASDAGRTGVWKFEDWITIDVLNYNDDNPLKEIWLQLTYYMEDAGTKDPLLYTLPGEDLVQLIGKEQIPSSIYWTATYQITITPNPDSEVIYVEPRDCTFYLDDIIVDTICTVPEPATFGLLAVGALALLRKRRA